MGADHNVYVGPYLWCPNPETKKPVTHEGCPRCQIRTNGKFCSRCGTRRDKYEKVETANKVSYQDVDEAIPELYNKLHGLSPYDLNEEANIYLPNLRMIKGREPSFSRNDGKVGRQEITTERIDQEIKFFKEKYAKEIEVLRGLFGEAKVEHGVVVYFN
jgi:hypothetical protein